MANYKRIPTFTAARLALFWKQVLRVDALECWNWLGLVSTHGYGRFGPHFSHRVSWKLANGPIPDGLTLDHLCRNRLCVNPQHLEPVSSVVNTMRGKGSAAINARKSHCARGHEFTPENTLTRADGHRQCRACRAGRPLNTAKTARAEGRCVRCWKTSDTYRCAECRTKHNADNKRYR